MVLFMRFKFAALFAIFLYHSGLGLNNPGNLQLHSRYNNGAFFTKFDHILTGDTITSVYVPSMIMCNQKCLAKPGCYSFNYQLNNKDAMPGLCELLRSVVGDENNQQSFQYKPGFVFTQIYAKNHMPASCLDHSRNGALQSGLYEVYDNSGNRYQVYCDLNYEPGMAWTLVISQSFKHRALPRFQVPIFEDEPLNQDTPRWDAYRLSLSRMQQLKSVSTHWRVTCNFDTEGVLYRDYVRARFNEFDPISYSGKGLCKKVEYMNVRGHNCTGCTAAWWQFKEPGAQQFLHHDSFGVYCQFGNTPGAVNSENNFGFYGNDNANSQFRCTSTDFSTTNHWFGGHV